MFSSSLLLLLSLLHIAAAAEDGKTGELSIWYFILVHTELIAFFLMCYNVTTSLLLHASSGGAGVGKNDHLLPPSSPPPPQPAPLELARRLTRL